MILKLKAIGKGIASDPLRAPLPTWTFIDHDPDTGIMTIDVPSYAHPFTQDELATIASTTDNATGVVHVLTDEQIATFRDYLATNYPEHAGEYPFEIVP